MQNNSADKLLRLSEFNVPNTTKYPTLKRPGFIDITWPRNDNDDDITVPECRHQEKFADV